RRRATHRHVERALQQPALDQLAELSRRDRHRQPGDEDRETAAARDLDCQPGQVAVPAPEAEQVVERGEREREREQLPAEARQLLPERAEVGVEPEGGPHDHRQRGGEDQPALQVNARIAAAVTIQPATVSRIGTSLSSTCSGSSPTSWRCISSREPKTPKTTHRAVASSALECPAVSV